MTGVLHLTRDFPPRANGGLSTAVAGLVRHSRSAGIRCGVVSFDGWRPRGGGEPEPVQRESELLRVHGPTQLSHVMEFAAEFAPDIVHVHDGMLWEVAAQLSQPSVFHAHVLHAEVNRLRGVHETTLSLAGERAAFRQAHAVVVPSHAVRRLVVAPDSDARDSGAASESRVNPDRVHVVGFGVEAAPLAVPDHPHLLYVGRLADMKGTDRLFEMLPTILAAVPQASAEIVGGIPENASAERRWRRRWESEVPAPIRDGVSWSGWQEPAGVAAALTRATLLFAPSRFETFGLALVEAMAAGVPVVATAVGAIPEVVESGRVVAVEELVGAAVELLQDPPLARRLGEAARRQVVSRRSWETAISALREVYGACLTARR